jgi:hypothetical protein
MSKAEAPQDVIRRLSTEALSVVGRVNYRLVAVYIYVGLPRKDNPHLDIIAEYWDFRNLKAAKRVICAFLDSHTYVSCIEIEYQCSKGSNGSLYLNMVDGSFLYVDRRGRHVITIDTLDVCPVRMHDVHSLVFSDRLDEIRKWVPEHVHINQGYNGMTMLHEAIRSGSTKVVTWLVQQPGIAINAANRTGVSPFMLAARSLNVEAMRVLHRHGAIIYTEDGSQDNAFRMIVRSVDGYIPDRFDTCLSFLGDHMPLSLMVSNPSPLTCLRAGEQEEICDLVKGDFYTMCCRVRDNVFDIVNSMCNVRVLANIIVGYWQEWDLYRTLSDPFLDARNDNALSRT